ncbi:lamin tail domain-containing protein [Kiritimatiellaeota bacterium B1221]|nr:lamin tail domain-containing protein [Kiritimatiellaeota bacterium B1221]
MKIRNLILAASLGLAGTSASADLIITEVMSNSDHSGGAGNGDWFEIYNSGPAPVDLSAWSWDDDSAIAGTNSFGSTVIGAGEFLLVVDENATLISNWQNDVWGLPGTANVIGNAVGGFSGFGAGGDTIYIYDHTNTQHTSAVFGDSDGGGKSFSWDTAGNYLGFSANGVDGAFVALLDGNDGAGDDNPSLYGPGIDIASPGTAIPEPGTIALFLIAGLAALAGLRRRRS